MVSFWLIFCKICSFLWKGSSTGLTKHHHCVLIWKLNWIFHGEYYHLNITVIIKSFSALNVTLNTTLIYYHNQALDKKRTFMGESMTFFWKRLLSHEIFSSIVPWVTECFLENLQNPLPPPTYLMYAPLIQQQDFSQKQSPTTSLSQINNQPSLISHQSSDTSTSSPPTNPQLEVFFRFYFNIILTLWGRSGQNGVLGVDNVCDTKTQWRSTIWIWLFETKVSLILYF